MPATANGYSQAARIPSCLNNNLWKDSFILMFHMISDNFLWCIDFRNQNKENSKEATETKRQKFYGIYYSKGNNREKAYRIGPGKEQQVLKGNKTATPKDSTTNEPKY